MIIENEDMKNNSLKKNTVVKLATNPDGKRLAVGYSDGVVNTFDLTTGDITETYQGHRSAITALSYNSECDMLASGSKVSNFFFLTILQFLIKHITFFFLIFRTLML